MEASPDLSAACAAPWHASRPAQARAGSFSFLASVSKAATCGRADQRPVLTYVTIGEFAALSPIKVRNGPTIAVQRAVCGDSRGLSIKWCWSATAFDDFKLEDGILSRMIPHSFFLISHAARRSKVLLYEHLLAMKRNANG